MFEHRKEALLSRIEFAGRMLFCVGVASIIVIIALLIGILGYHHFEHLPWIDAFANASMILSGMGPLMTVMTDKGKIFASLYALFSGLAFAAVLGIVFVAVFLEVLLHVIGLFARPTDHAGAFSPSNVSRKVATPSSPTSRSTLATTPLCRLLPPSNVPHALCPSWVSHCTTQR